MNITNVIYTDTYQKQKVRLPDRDVDKLEQAIEVHGYRGASKKKHNGVVPIRPSDKELWKSLARFKDGVEFKGEHIVDVKVVAHLTDGTRGVGCLYRSGDDLTLYVLGFSNYNYQIF